MATALVHPGVCGLRTRIQAASDAETGEVTITMDSECPSIKRLAETITRVDGYQAAFTPAAGNPVYQAAAQARLHASCVVPAAILKTVEIAAGLALPSEVNISFEK